MAGRRSKLQLDFGPDATAVKLQVEAYRLVLEGADFFAPASGEWIHATMQLYPRSRHAINYPRHATRSRGVPATAVQPSTPVLSLARGVLAVTSAKPLVYGYVRAEWPDEEEISEICADIGAYCEVHEYQLGKVFVDRGVPDDVFARTGFIDLLDSVRLTQAHAVVVPTVDHLSSDAFVQDALKRMVELTKARLFVVYEANGGSPPVEGGRDIGSDPGVSS